MTNQQELYEATLRLYWEQGLKFTMDDLSERLMISKRTVDNHVSNIFTKTGAKNRVALLNWAMDNGKICRDGFNCCSIEPGKA